MKQNYEIKFTNKNTMEVFSVDGFDVIDGLAKFYENKEDRRVYVIYVPLINVFAIYDKCVVSIYDKEKMMKT